VDAIGQLRLATSNATANVEHLGSARGRPHAFDDLARLAQTGSCRLQCAPNVGELCLPEAPFGAVDPPCGGVVLQSRPPDLTQCDIWSLSNCRASREQLKA